MKLYGDASRLSRSRAVAVLLVLGTLGGASRTALGQSSQPAVSTLSPNARVVHTYARPADSVLKEKLTPLQYAVTQKAFTEQAFMNEYWNNHAAGIYVDVVSGQPEFSSLDKYDSKTGWPSFTRPLDAANITTRTDSSLPEVRTEVRSAGADSHLGHLFHDGPKPAGLRYCMNSAALRFIPVDSLASEGYGEYAALFKNRKR